MAEPSAGTKRIFYASDGVFDAITSHIREGAGIVVEGDRIVAVGLEREVSSNATDRVQLRGYIVPGFVDSHTHITVRPGEGGQHEQLAGPPIWQALRGVKNLQEMLASGVTLARIMTENNGIDVEFREAIARGDIVGPELRVSREGLTPPGGHSSSSAGVSGIGPLRDIVRKRAEAGADHIKVFATGGVSSSNGSLEAVAYSADELTAIVDEARAANLTVSAHAQAGPGIGLAVAAGVHSIEHGSMINEETAEEMGHRGTWLVLTSSILFHPSAIEMGDGHDPAIMTKLRAARTAAANAALYIQKYGVRVAIGTDSMHGLIGFEMQWMVENGWTPAEALLAATRSGAELMGVPGVGVLKPGSRANFVVLASNPIEDIAAVCDVVRVYLDGAMAYERKPSLARSKVRS